MEEKNKEAIPMEPNDDESSRGSLDCEAMANLQAVETTYFEEAMVTVDERVARFDFQTISMSLGMYALKTISIGEL